MPSELNRESPENRKLRQALYDVEPPPELAERIIAALTAAQAPQPRTVEAPSQSRRFGGRAIALFAATGVAAVLLVGLGLYRVAPRVGSVAHLEQAATAALVTTGNTHWSADLESVEAQYPWGRWLSRKPQRWRATQVSGDAGVIYDLVGTDEGGAVLLVVRSRREYDLPTLPTDRPYASNSLQRSVSWKRPGLVYVLATNGRLDKPEHFLKAQRFASAGTHLPTFASR